MCQKEATSVIFTTPVSSTVGKTTAGKPADQLHELDSPLVLVEAEQSNARSSQEARSVKDTAPLSSSARKTTEKKLASLLRELDLPSHSQIQVEASGHRKG